jgi:[ribosomal protein S18]-alanine N-acetyltransferase
MSVFDWLHRTPPVGRIAPLDTEHAGRLAAIHGSAFARPWDGVEFERLLADRAVLADGLFLGRDPEPAGFVLSRIVVDEAEILTVAIAAAARGKGHARPLLSQHLDALARIGARIVHLEVEEMNLPALSVYRALGFQEVGRRAGYYLKTDGTRAAALTMSRPL